MADLEAVAEVKAECIADNLPAYTVLGVIALSFPGQMIEIEAVAASG